jgi:hypothetical protein
MTTEQLDEISKKSGDFIENKWKPGNTEDYLDLYYYWKLRDVNAAGTIEGYKSIGGDSLISQSFLFKLERIPQYYHTVFCRVAALKTTKLELEEFSKRVLAGSNETDILYNKIETFYFFCGSILDNLAGLSNIILNNSRGKEDSFSDFFGYIDKGIFTEEEIAILTESLNIKGNYRDHFSHRPRLGLLSKTIDGVTKIHLQDQFIKTGPADRLITWRKEFRDIIEGRKSTSDIISLINKHFQIIEKTANILFKYCFLNYNNFLTSEVVEKAEAEIIIDPTQIPQGCQFIFYRCLEERDPYLKYWYHSVANPLPVECSLETCKSQILKPIYFVKA